MGDRAVWDTMLEGCFHHGVDDKADDVFQSMVVYMKTWPGTKIYPGPRTFNIMITGFCRLGRLDDAIGLKDRMAMYNYNPSKQIYCSLIVACIDAGQIYEALGFLKELKYSQIGIIVDDWVYMRLMQYYVQRNDMKGTLKMAKKTIKAGYPLTTEMMDCVARVAEHNGETAIAEMTVEQLIVMFGKKIRAPISKIKKDPSMGAGAKKLSDGIAKIVLSGRRT
eukprot:GFYU01011580.1.p1 GENE.GFYU01011580.1~~GFYU01011580.1.p1  ORF type:complete len:222 (-),score=57.54 GFYU01011580.1:162-827(-)